MNDILRAQLKRMNRTDAEGMISFMQYAWPVVFPGERFERTPTIEAIAEAVVSQR